MTELSNKTLAQIVTNNHRTASVFEMHQLDFCCKGKRTLAQACSEKNIPLNLLVNELATILEGSSGTCQVSFPFDRLTLTQLADYIINTHHAYVKKELDPLFAYLQKVASKHGGRHPELLKIFDLFTSLKEEMEEHMKKEELILFPRIKEIEKYISGGQELQGSISYLSAPITVMEQEHDHAGRLMQEMRLLSNQYTPPADACTTYQLSFASLKAFEMDLHQHVHLENNILFPKAITMFKSVKESTFN